VYVREVPETGRVSGRPETKAHGNTRDPRNPRLDADDETLQQAEKVLAGSKDETKQDQA